MALLLLGFEGLSLVGKVDFEDNLHENHWENDAYYTKRISGCVTHRHALNGICSVGIIDFIESLLRSTKTGSVGDSTWEHTHKVGDVDVTHTEVDDERYHQVETHDKHGKAIEHDATFLEWWEETGTHLNTDREDKQDKSELFDEM